MKINFHYTNLDNFMGTRESATVTMYITADDQAHAHMLANHLQRVLGADYWSFGD